MRKVVLSLILLCGFSQVGFGAELNLKEKNQELKDSVTVKKEAVASYINLKNHILGVVFSFLNNRDLNSINKTNTSNHNLLIKEINFRLEQKAKDRLFTYYGRHDEDRWARFRMRKSTGKIESLHGVCQWLPCPEMTVSKLLQEKNIVLIKNSVAITFQDYFRLETEDNKTDVSND